MYSKNNNGRFPTPWDHQDFQPNLETVSEASKTTYRQKYFSQGVKSNATPNPLKSLQDLRQSSDERFFFMLFSCTRRFLEVRMLHYSSAKGGLRSPPPGRRGGLKVEGLKGLKGA